MTTQKQHDLFKKHFGRVPERATLYPLPDDKRGGQEYACIGMTTETGEVLLFEFDFTVPGRFCLPWECLENSIPHHCKTCEWDFLRGENTLYCPRTAEVISGECPDWELGPMAHVTAEAEYLKQLHEKHYGKISVSV